ncbi:MAG: diguanylate cyclase [Mycobacterium sp.]|nr:diguanylate cyclase [Mycobacterium sp.]
MTEAGPRDVPSAEWFERIADNSGVVFFVLRVHPDLAYEYISEAVESRVGVTPAEILADADTLHSRLDPEFLGILSSALATQPGHQISVELKWRHRNGTPIFTRCWMQARQRPDGSVIMEGTVGVITELREMQAELRHSEERYRLLAENAWEVIWTMALDASITYVSSAVERVRGITPAEAMNQSLEQIHPPESAAKVGNYFAELFAAIENGTEVPLYRAEHEYYRKDGSIMTGELQVIPHLDAQGKVVEILGVTRDISERKTFEAELTRLAVTDPLTGLWNRRQTTELLTADLAQAHRHGRALTLLMVDVDRFKSINDTHGHQTGDRVLIEVANRLLEQVRTTDVVGRWGGEEFVVLLRHCSLRDGVAIAEKLRQQITDVAFDNLFSISVSIGAAELHDDDDLLSWVARADAALYQAKRSGRNAVAEG